MAKHVRLHKSPVGEPDPGARQKPADRHVPAGDRDVNGSRASRRLDRQFERADRCDCRRRHRHSANAALQSGCGGQHCARRHDGERVDLQRMGRGRQPQRPSVRLALFGPEIIPSITECACESLDFCLLFAQLRRGHPHLQLCVVR